MKTIFVILSLISFLFLASSCPKNDGGPKNSNPQLPPITQTGANTYGCLLNGKVWIPGGPSTLGLYGFIAQYYKGNFTLSANKKDDTSDVVIHWQHTNIYKTRTFYLNSHSTTFAAYTDYYNNKYNYMTSDKDSLNNSVTITKFDTAHSIISGTFNLLFDKVGLDTIRITNGRFDVKYTN